MNGGVNLDDSVVVMQSKIEVFNERHPVGSVVTVINDYGEKIVTKVKHPADILSGHTAVVWLDNISGAYLLNRVIA